MFNPKITPGEWQYLKPISSDSDPVVCLPNNGFIIPRRIKESIGNAKAICAVPELLEVLKKVYPLISALNIMGSGHPGPDFEELIDLEEEIKKLEKRHCDG